MYQPHRNRRLMTEVSREEDPAEIRIFSDDGPDDRFRFVGAVVVDEQHFDGVESQMVKHRPKSPRQLEETLLLVEDGNDYAEA